MIPTVTCRLLDMIQQQLNAQLDHCIDLYGQDADCELITPLNRADWTERGVFESMTFEYEWFTGSFKQLLSAFQLFHDIPAEDEFSKELTKQMREMVIGRLQYWTDQRVQENQAVYVFELNQIEQETVKAS